MNRMRRWVSVMTIVGLVLLFCGVPVAWAYTYSTVTTDTSTSGTYSPSRVRGVMGWDDVHDELMTKAYDMYWTSERRTNLINYAAGDLYYTCDISVSDQYNTSLDAYSASTYYSDLPSPHFDRDDDPEPFGNGYGDETEVTMLRSDLMTAGTNYMFFAYFDVINTSSASLEWTSQLSYPVLGEYDTDRYEFHFAKSFPWW